MQSTTSLFRTSLRRTALPLVRARPYSVGTGSIDAQAQASSSGLPSPEASSSAQQATGDVSASSSSTPSSGADSEPSTSSSTSTPTQSRTRSQNRTPKIPSTSSTAEYVRENGIPGFLPRESFENVEKWVGGHWERLEAEMQCESSRW